jgi:drug/metabolite transporter (DMT)-like permease
MARSVPSIRGDALLFATALIWGFAFVAQRVGMDHVGPFAFNAARYLVGAVSLLPVLLLLRKKGATKGGAKKGTEENEPSARAMADGSPPATRKTAAFLPPLLAGACMFMGATLQQVGLVTTTAGNAAFITSLYVVLVPFIGSLFGKRVGAFDWLASLVAVAGLWLITIRVGFTVSPGDLLELIGAFFWALHIIVIGRFANHYDPIKLSIGQFTIAGVLSLLISLVTEKNGLVGLSETVVPVLYGGVASCGVAFTLQIFGQRTARASHASIILALEGLFGAIGGILILGEPATARILAGGGLMIVAAVLPQVLAIVGTKADSPKPESPSA